MAKTQAQHKEGHEAQEQSAAQHEAQGEAHASQAHDKGSFAYTINDVALTLARKYAAGDVMDANVALIADMARARQFKNNIEAKQKALAKKGEPLLTSEQIASEFVAYMPSIGDTPRQSTVERVAHDATMRAIVEAFKEHNDAVLGATGDDKAAAGVFAKFLGQPINVPKDESTREALIARWQANPAYAGRIQRHVDAINAERDARKAKSKEAKPGEATISVDDF